MTRGFITIATGAEMYYQLAKNLLLSYKLFCDSPYPLAILCDQENEYTALFDQVILFQPGRHPYFDKFELLKRAPFDETIFIDADCLAYADLNAYWDYFAQADDFSAAGANYPLDSTSGLFRIDEIGEYRERVLWKPVIHGGLYFIRKGAVCDAIYEDCQKIARDYDSYHWPDICAPFADEPVLCLAMAANGCRATEADPQNYGIPWEVTQLECDLFTGKCRYATEWHPLVEQGYMIHWSVRYTKKPLYLFEVEKLYLMVKNRLRPSKSGVSLNLWETLLYRFQLRYYYLQLKDLSIRAVRKLWRIITRTTPTD
ncbi:MAG: hypothetical protein ACI3WQ_05710 [Faecousia sp.]